MLRFIFKINQLTFITAILLANVFLLNLPWIVTFLTSKNSGLLGKTFSIENVPNATLNSLES